VAQLCIRREVQAQHEGGVQGFSDGAEAALELVAHRDPQRYDGPQLGVRVLEQRDEPRMQRRAVRGCP
jgi:hypothetical protein